MIRLKKICILVLCSLTLVGIKDARAGVPKIDLGVISKVFESVSRVVDKFSEKTKDLEKKINFERLGKGWEEATEFAQKNFDSGKNFLNEVKDKADNSELVNSAKNAYNDAKDKVEGSELLDSAKNAYNDAKSKVDGAKEDLEKAGINQETIQELRKLKADREEMLAEYDSRSLASLVQFDGSIAAVDDNIKMLTDKLSVEAMDDDQKLAIKDKILEQEDVKRSILTDKMAKSQEIDLEKNAKLKELDDKIKVAMDLLDKVGLGGVKDKVAGYWGAIDTKKSMEDTADKMYLDENTPKTSNAIADIRKSRRQIAFESSLNAFVVGLSIQQKIDDSNKRVEDLASGSNVLEGSNSAIALNIGEVIAQTKDVLMESELLAAELRLKSSMSSSMSTDYSRTDGNRDITKFSFDDYDFNRNCRR